MTFEIEYEYPEVILPDYGDIIKKVILAALDEEKCPYESQVYVLLTDNEQIREINLEHRGIDSPTDVLSFPLCHFPRPGDFSRLEEEEADAFHPDTGELILGDIIVSVDKIKEQAKEYGHSPTRELAFLTAHSMLHLMGYDHMEEDDRLDMEARQRIILDECGYKR